MTVSLVRPVASEVVIKKSRFLGCVEPIHSGEEGLAKLHAYRQQHPDARHLCFCMLVDGEVRQSDDGEPSGTAALPMLRVLQHKQLDQVLATVVRYFGGIKLGAGGLTRAYSQAISEPLNTAEFAKVVHLLEQRLAFDYEFETLVRHYADRFQVQLHIDYQQQVCATLTGEQQQLDLCWSALQEASSGRIVKL